MVYDDGGQLTNGNLMEYLVPSFATTPEEFVSILVEDGGGPGPGGSRGIGEAGSLVVMPAIANAVHDAVGLRFKETPLTPGEFQSDCVIELSPRTRLRIEGQKCVLRKGSRFRPARMRRGHYCGRWTGWPGVYPGVRRSRS